MTRTQRVALLGVAVIVLVGAFALLRPDDEPSRPAASTTSAGTPRPEREPVADATSPPKRAPTGAREGPLLVAGRTQRIEVRKGDRVQLRARASRLEELHVHGYDLMRELAPGQTIRLEFSASIEGVFEVEFENSGAEVASLVVQP